MGSTIKSILGRYRVVLLVVALLVASTAVFLALRNRSSGQTESQPIPSSGNVTLVGGGATGMRDTVSNQPIRLSEGQAQPQVPQPVSQVTGEPLSAEQVERITARLPDLPVSAQEQVDFKLPADPIPPPRSGETINQPFPPPAGVPPPEPGEAGPLQVLRYAPTGEIPIAPFVNITFNQPMVNLGTLHDLASAEVPVRLEPTLPGTWRWLGTKTLTFQYDSQLIDRLPKSTEYRVTIPAGTRSATGGVLSDTVEWTFSTPPPKVMRTYPDDSPQPLHPLFFITFDQRIDPAAALESLQVRAGGRNFSLRLASQSEIQADERVKLLAKEAPEGRWLAFKTTETLPGDAEVSVTVNPGMPSAEGPLVTQESQSYRFRTYAALRIEEHGCDWSPCQPLAPFFIRFNNPIDPVVYEDTWLTIQPELPGAAVDIYDRSLHIRGASQGQTTYTVLVSAELRDVFGQKLGRETRLTFRVGPAEPALFGPEKIFVTLDPAAGKPAFSVYSLNYSRLQVKIHAVQPSDWPAFKKYQRDYQRTDIPVSLPGRVLLDEEMRVESPSDVLSEVSIDLSRFMDGEFGHFIIVVDPPKELFKAQEYWRRVHAWVQVTQIGLDVFSDHSEMVVWATGLQDGAPLAGVAIQPGPSGTPLVTAEDGTARFPLPSGASYLVASLGVDHALLPRSEYYWWDEENWNPRPVQDEIRWYIFDDRQMYRPGEEVHLKGWLRRIGGKQDGDVGLVGAAVSGVRYQLIESQGNVIASGRAEVNTLGGFDFVLTLPEEVNLGYASVNLEVERGQTGAELSKMYGLNTYHGFQIQEFRRPEFEVTARNESPGPYFAGEHAVVAVEAKYYAGDPLPNAEVTWQVASSPSNYSPPNWPDFIFGIWRPWWYFGPVFERGFYGPSFDSDTRYETFSGQTDPTGTHYLRLDFPQPEDHRPLSVLAEGTVMDVNRQAWTGTTSLLVHPGELYVGLRSERLFVERGAPLIVDFIVTDLDGNPIPDRLVEVTAGRLDWKTRGNQSIEEEVDVQTCRLGSATEPVSCTFETPVGGTYRITATVSDDLGRKNRSQFTRWVSGGQSPPARAVEQENLTLIPDQETYQPGEVARILVQSPFSPAEGILTVNRSGILYTERFRISDGTITLEVPIDEAHVPNLHVQVDVAGATPRLDDRGDPIADVPPRPAYATGQLNLSIPPLSRTIYLQATPTETELEPGGSTTIDVVVKDAGGQPVPEAELAVVVVDEAILALTNYRLADPLSIFYADRPAELASQYGRASIVLVDPQALAGRTSAIQEEAKSLILESAVEGTRAAVPEAPAMEAADMAGAGELSTPIRVRLDFNPLANFTPSARTDGNGQAQITVNLPDNLTRYRVMVLAVAEGRYFGLAESSLVARLPLMVRPSAPRFLNFGDHFELPVVLQNQTDEALQVDVVVRGSNIELTGNPGLRVSVPPRDRVEVRFPATTLRAGTAVLQIAAVGGAYADAATVQLPVYTPATTEAFATYGVVDQGAIFQPVASPTDVFAEYGGLEISTSSTALQALTDAVLYLVTYPFDCSEQLASRILAVAALRDVLTAFSAEGLPTPAEMQAAVERDIAQLQGLQNVDGGFPTWRRGQESIPFNTIHVAHALRMAELKGFRVPPEMGHQLRDHLRQIENVYPAWYNQGTRQTLSAYALYVRHLMGDSDPEKARRLLPSDLEEFPLEAIGWLWPVLQDAPGASGELDAIRAHINNRAVETASAANFTTAYDDQSYLLLNSDRRTDAILLEALIGDNPQHDLIPKLVNGLLAHRTRGRWSNTQENVFILIALDRYFNTFEAQTPEFVVRIWLGDTYAGGHQYIGRTTDRQETVIPMNNLVDGSLGEGESRDLIISKEGPGRLYYRLGLRYAPTDLDMEAVDMGFVVRRSYEAVDDPADVRQDEDGTWHIRSGARVRVRLTLVADNRRYHVALVDRLPAGLEIINPAMAVSGGLPVDPDSQDRSSGWWWWGPWFEHQNLRDERAEAFTTLLWDGVYEYTYIARATTPGRFVVPPAKAEEMYSPEVFGRSHSDVVVVE
jgi:alpha-2-macroglobulin